MLTTRLLRTLGLGGAAGGAHLSAASGLVRRGGRLYVVADDEHALGCFDAGSQAPGVLLRLFDGELPGAHEARKAAKPDLEALAWLPWPGPGGGALLALGSGSRPQRERGACWLLGDQGAPVGAPRMVDLAPLYAPLRARFGGLNIEGAFVAGDTLMLLQRAHRRAPVNAGIEFDLGSVCAWLADGACAPPPRRIDEHVLGTLGGVPLGFTDGVALPPEAGGGWLFSAAAEDTADAYLDGDCAGSVLGRVDAAGALVGWLPLARGCKVEGLALGEAPGTLLMVTDADDRAQAAQLLAADLPLRFWCDRP